ncbi:hypothetical protein CPB83DRAFT_853669 [Crepidotus variabilis]|uniref:Rhodopsin domain-containing protein n=1 Tax=Crepidotus variabilis TaxID=179855 RepID=A0A9P6JQN0_9AGAR|nr:hypothetical protein CPB83DRAFT_853669 [Crepidotus variabilis]
MLKADGLPSGFDPWTIACFILYLIAILVTLLRLGHRAYRRQLYWDDFWALVALVSAVIDMVIMLVVSTIRLQDMTSTSHSFVLWITIFAHPFEVWCSRMSITLSMFRVLLPGRKRTLAKTSCYLMSCFATTICLQKIWSCSGMTAPAIPWCTFTSLTPALSLSLNTLADIFLIVWPALMLTEMKLNKTHRWFLIACFSTSVFVMVIDCLYSAYFLKGDLTTTVLLGHIEIVITLLFCNTTVLATYLYRQYSNSNTCGDSGYALPISDFHAANASNATSNLRLGNPRNLPQKQDQSVVLDTVEFSKISEGSLYLEHGQISSKTAHSTNLKEQKFERALSEKDSGFGG